MSKVTSLVKLSFALVFCITIVNCGNKTTAQPADTETAEADTTVTKIDPSNFVVSGEPEQLLEIDKALLDFAKSLHINSKEDVDAWVNALADTKDMMTAVSDTLNAQLEVMTPEEKGDMVARASDVSDKIEENNDILTKELVRLEKEAKKIGLTLPIDL